MANAQLPTDKCNTAPDQAETLDVRCDLGHTFLVIAGQFAVIATVLLLWVRQDLSYSPGWAHPIAYYFYIVLGVIAALGAAGFVLRRGTLQTN
jgi:nitrate reductase gamma subunit